jgi:tetratricopeptide (TPR) repeat protein
VDWSSVLHAATETFRQRNFSQVVAACREALAQAPDVVELRLLLAKALMALRRDAEAQVEVAYCLRLGPKCPDAYQLLGELAFRRDELNAAEIFFREALRLDPEDVHSRVLIDIIRSLRTRPAAAAAKLPAASAAAGPSFVGRKKGVPSRLALGSDPGIESERRSIARTPGPERTALEASRRDGGFGEYLVRMGVLTRQQLFTVLNLHYRDNSRIGDAAVRLGYARPDIVEQYARAYHDWCRSQTSDTFPGNALA